MIASARPARPPTRARVPFLDLARVHAPLRERMLGEIAAVIDAGEFGCGPQVAAFEREFAAFCGAGHCTGVASGLDALRLALLAAGIGTGDEVVVPANTLVATAEAVTQTGAVPVFADASEADYNVDVASVEAAITPRTRAVVAVHLYGQMADVVRLAALCARHRLLLLEDAAQAHGAERDGERAGSAGDAAAFSFYPAKNLGAIGDAGAVTTRDATVAALVRALREHGQRQKHAHERVGYTSRLDEIQAGVLRLKLRELPAWTEQRRALASAYRAALAGMGDLRTPPLVPGSKPVHHLFPVRSVRAGGLAAHLRARGIATGRHYPTPVPLTPAYRTPARGEDAFPVAAALARELLSLPLFPGLTEREIEHVARAVREFFRRG